MNSTAQTWNIRVTPQCPTGCGDTFAVVAEGQCGRLCFNYLGVIPYDNNTDIVHLAKTIAGLLHSEQE